MTDKLIELIKEYGKLCGLDRGSSYDILTNKQENELNDSTDKARQAIIDYHDKKVQKAANPFSNANVDNIGEIAKKIYKQGQREAIKPIREVIKEYKDYFETDEIPHGMDYCSIMEVLKQAIEQTIANVDGKGESDG